MFFLPDRDPGFDLVDYVAAGGEGLGPVSGKDGNPYRYLSDLEAAYSMDAPRTDNLEALAGLRDYLVAFGNGHSIVGLIGERSDGLSLVGVANAALEDNAGPGPIIVETQ